MKPEERSARIEAIKRKTAQLEEEGGWRFRVSHEGQTLAEGSPDEFLDAMLAITAQQYLTLDVAWTRATPEEAKA